jgi:signal peptidase II
LKNKILDYVYLISVAGLIVLFDQLTKEMVRSNIPMGTSWSPWEWLAPYARIVHWSNTGAAFGILQDFGKVFMALAFLVSIAILYYYPQIPRSDWVMRLALGMQLGGALGNLVDRLMQQGRVTDFISVGNFAVFNVADASISVGVVILILAMWFKEQQSKPVAQETAASTGMPAEDPASSLPEEVKGE